MDNWYLVAAVVLFVAFLLWNGLRSAPMRRSARARLAAPDGADRQLEGLLEELRNGAMSGPILSRIRKRIAQEKNPVEKAVCLCAAGNILKNSLSRRATAIRYYKAALKHDPTCEQARLGLKEILLSQRRGFALEQLYWKLLARLDPEKHDWDLILRVWHELSEILSKRRSAKARATALRLLLDQLEAADEPLPPEET